MKWMFVLLVILTTACNESGTERASSAVKESSLATHQRTQPDSDQFIPSSRFEKWKADTAMYFYKSLSLYNYRHAAKYVTKPELLLAMEDNESLQLTVKENSFRVIDVTDEGALMAFSRHCYKDREVMVYMDHLSVGFRIDFERTMREGLQNKDEQQPLEKYCYDFKDQPLAGTVLSNPWKAQRVATSVVNYPSGSQTQIAVVNERCEQFPECTYIGDRNHSGFIFYVHALDLSGDGGNLGPKNYVRLFNYPDYNESYYEGSYRVTHLPSGKIRLELSLPDDGSTEINGYIEFNLNQLIAEGN